MIPRLKVSATSKTEDPPPTWYVHVYVLTLPCSAVTHLSFNCFIVVCDVLWCGVDEISFFLRYDDVKWFTYLHHLSFYLYYLLPLSFSSLIFYFPSFFFILCIFDFSLQLYFLTSSLPYFFFFLLLLLYFLSFYGDRTHIWPLARSWWQQWRISWHLPQQEKTRLLHKCFFSLYLNLFISFIIAIFIVLLSYTSYSTFLYLFTTKKLLIILLLALVSAFSTTLT